METKAVIFDLFNTLVKGTTPAEAIIKAFNLDKGVLPELNEAICGQKFNWKQAKGWETYLGKVAEAAGVENTEANREAIRQEMDSALKRGLKRKNVYPHTRKVLAGLKAKGFKLGLASESAPYARKLLEETGLAKFFDTIVLSSEIGFTKRKSSRLVGLCIKRIGMPENTVVMVGDNFTLDIKAASKASGGKVKGILISKRPSAKARQFGCEIIPSLEKVPAALRRLNLVGIKLGARKRRPRAGRRRQLGAGGKKPSRIRAERTAGLRRNAFRRRL